MICHQQMYYFETAKVMPTRDEGESVLMFSVENQNWIGIPTKVVLARTELFKSLYSHWMQMPKNPSPTDAHAFIPV